MTIEEAIYNLNYFLPEGCDETKRMAIEALQKQIPKAPIDITSMFDDGNYVASCAVCDGIVFGKFCSDCGQKLDWSDTE